MNTHENIDFLELIIQETYRLPFEFLQGAALVGFFALILLVRSDRHFVGYENLRPTYAIGLGMGIACFAQVFLLSEHMTGTSLKPTLGMVDFIFISGLIGGWSNAFITFLFASFIRVFFGGMVNADIAILSYATFIASGALAHRFVIKEIFTSFGFKHFVLVMCWKFIFAIVVSLLFIVTGLVEFKIGALLLAKRITSSFTVSAFIVGAILLLFRHARESYWQLFYDSVSGLPNHRSLQKYFEELVSRRSKQENIVRALMFVQVTNFKQLVQAYGYEWIDNFIKEFTNELQSIANRPQNRELAIKNFAFSEDSVVVILQGVGKSHIQERAMAHRLLTELRMFTEQNDYDLLPSFGISVIDIDLKNKQDPVHFLRTFSLLGSGKTGVHYFEPTLVQQMLLEEKIRARIRQWIKDSEVPLALQPQVNLANGHCHGAEALLRTYAEATSSTYIPPHTVLDIAEKYNLRHSLEWAVICTAVKYISSLSESLSHLKIAVNLTPDMLTTIDFHQRVIDLLRTFDVKPRQLVFEIIETNRVTFTPVVGKNISQLASHGIWFSLDDFGTGYSSITLLSQYRFKELKIDRSMTSNCTNPRVYAAIQISIGSAKTYEAAIVAEGIETDEQRRLLLYMGAEYGQGFLFSRAISFEDFVRFAEKKQQELSVA